MDKEKAAKILHMAERMILKHKYAVLVLFAGFIMLSLGAESNQQKAAPTATEAQNAIQSAEQFDLIAFEQRLEQTLSQIDGVGRVELTLSLKATEEAIYAADIRRTQQNQKDSTYESSLSIMSDSGYGEQPILVKNLYPTFRGALVLCDGAGDDTVRLAVTQAVGTMCGLGTDKVSVLKMQS